MENTGIAFVIMQIGNKDLDDIYDSIYVESIEAANLIPKRIDKDNSGFLLKSEIVGYIEKAEIIIADLTNERPNCYLEIGYAMGLDKFKNLIFTVREDHFPDNKDYKKGGPKIHFDVSGYEILSWNPNNLEDFKSALTNKIERRLATINSANSGTSELLITDNWIEEQQKIIKDKYSSTGNKREMQIAISPLNTNLYISQNELLDITDKAQVMTFGWPIGITFRDVPELKPIPKADGIISEISNLENRKSFDYSYFKKNGQIFIAKSLFEEEYYPNSIIPEVRIKRTTEILLYISRFYSLCNVKPSTRIKLEIKYLGLLDNTISFGNQGQPFRPKKSTENEVFTTIITSLSEIESNLPSLVKKLVDELFVIFDFYELELGYISEIANKYVTDTKNARR